MTKIPGKFYPLQHSEWLKACQQLTPSQRDVLYFLRTLDPYSNGISINTAEIARHLSTNGRTVHRQTVSRALKELDKKGFIDLELIQVNVTVKTKGLLYSQEFEFNENQQDKFIETPGCVETPDWIVTHPLGSSDTYGTPSLSPPAWISPPPYKTIKTLSENDEREKIEFSTNESEGKDSVRIETPTQPERVPVGKRGAFRTFSSTSAQIKDPVQDQFSAPRTTSRVQSVTWDWLPEGPWKIDGKLDPNFRDAIAHDWINRYGGEIHQRRADVLAHFKKDLANLPIRWEQYSSEYLHRYQNTQTLLNNGLSIDEEYQQKLIQNHRAITESLPEELNPVASSVTSYQLPVISDQKLITERQSGLGGFQGVSRGKQGHLRLPQMCSPCGQKLLSVEPPPQEELPDHCSLNTENLSPSNSRSDRTLPEVLQGERSPDGENAAAYQLWEPELVEEEASPEQVRELMRSLKSSFSMPKPTEQQPTTDEVNAASGACIPMTVDPLEELNIWIRDPILRPEAMKRATKSDRYAIEFDEFGNPIRVMEGRC